jgi:hypothetical protein
VVLFVSEERHNGPMLLSARAEEVDFLEVLAASRREVRVLLENDQPLRKPRKGQATWLRRLSADAREDLANQLAGRRPFRGRIAVRLDVTLPRRFTNFGLRRIAKEHLDLLRGLVFADDATVDHLEVHRRIDDVERVRVGLLCLPLSVFCADFDRAFRLADELAVEVPPRGWGSAFDQHDASLLGYDIGVLDFINELDAQEDEQLAEDPDGSIDLDIPSNMSEFADWQVRASTRAHLEDAIARSRARRLCDQGLDSRDRPGPTPRWQHEAHELDEADVLTLSDAGPGCFLLPAPPRRTRADGEHPWPWHLERGIWQQLSQERMTAVRFSGPVALDIAFRGGCANHADIDNLAHKIVAAFLRTLSRSSPDVSSYRSYRLDGGDRAVRLRVLPQSRLLALSDLMEQGRTLVSRERSSRRRAAIRY